VVAFGPPNASGSSNGCVTNVEPALIQNISHHLEQYDVNVHNEEFPDGAVRGQLRRVSMFVKPPKLYPSHLKRARKNVLGMGGKSVV
jgi:hypothetical protein